MVAGGTPKGGGDMVRITFEAGGFTFCLVLYRLALLLASAMR